LVISIDAARHVLLCTSFWLLFLLGVKKEHIKTFTRKKTKRSIFTISKNHIKARFVITPMSLPINLQTRELYGIDQFAVDASYRSHLSGILIPEGEITSRVARLAEEISADYNEKDIIALCMLDGAMRFFVELLYSEPMKVRFEVETLKAKSYAGDASTGKVTFSGFDFSKAEGRDVLIVEDIIDTGTTMRATLDKLAAQGAKSTSIVALLTKPERHQPGLQEQLAAHPLYLGFLIPDEFVVGYGLDYNGHYRGLRHLGVLNEEAFELAQTRK